MLPTRILQSTFSGFSRIAAPSTVLTLLALFLFTGCNGRPAESSNGGGKAALNRPIKVVCTTGQVADLARTIGGDRVAVEALMGPSVDPHQYKASLGDRRKIEAADIVFYNGLHLEGRMTGVLEDIGKKRPVVAVTAGIQKHAPEKLRKPTEFEGSYDPHVWFDVELWTHCAQEVADQLSKLDPEHQSEYRKRADEYIAQLKQLNKECRTAMASIPKEQRVLVTAHDAFGYFGKAYDVEVHGLQGISTADEADIASVRKLIAMLVDRKIKAVFIESSVPEKSVQNLIEGCKQQGHTVELGGELYSDAMGVDGSPEGTYPGMIRHNTKVIVEALK
ncbi:MAG: zinc ABC transporter substrate-binding protein [Planctomycetota bacterium]|nr:zinc ABC transporter substrate-binding protein [Planctomycetota bacterium]